MTQKVQVTSSYHDEILKGHLVVLLCYGFFHVSYGVFSVKRGALFTEESWPWCGIPCGLGHCEGLSGGNQQLPCKATLVVCQQEGQLAQLVDAF